MSSNRALWGIVLLAVALRIGASRVWFDRLNEDVDNYRGIAQMLADGRGYSNQFTAEPTAFRPPLLPLLLAGLLMAGGGNAAIAALQIALGAGTVLLTGLVARKLLVRGAWLPALIVAVDPLSLAYTPRVMTEVMAGFTLALLLLVLLWEWSRGVLWLTGLAFGLAALCRPTVWAFLPLAGVLLAVLVARKRVLVREALVRCATFATATAIVVGPWMVRNTIVLNAPVFATTHGGYTLLLSNNPEFYQEVARADWKTVWDSEPWQESLQRDLQTADVTGERATDRWMYNRAVANMRADPAGCALSCLVKFRRLWSFVPLVGAENPAVRWGVAGFYVLVFAGAISSVFCEADADKRLAFAASWIMIVAFTGVHLFYWANTRMRAPLISPLAILTTFGWLHLLNRNVNRAEEQA